MGVWCETTRTLHRSLLLPSSPYETLAPPPSKGLAICCGTVSLECVLLGKLSTSQCPPTFIFTHGSDQTTGFCLSFSFSDSIPLTKLLCLVCQFSDPPPCLILANLPPYAREGESVKTIKHTGQRTLMLWKATVQHLSAPTSPNNTQMTPVPIMSL